MRDTIKATVGFEKLGEAIDTPPKSLIRMFGPRGNPQAKNLFSVIGYLQKRAGVQLGAASVLHRYHVGGIRVALLHYAALRAAVAAQGPMV